jgi:pyruvate dehydrogenase E1 component beta subunit
VLGSFLCQWFLEGQLLLLDNLGATHSQAFESWFANTPGLKSGSSINIRMMQKGLLKSAIRDNDPSNISWKSEQMYGDKGEVPDGEYTFATWCC